MFTKDDIKTTIAQHSLLFLTLIALLLLLIFYTLAVEIEKWRVFNQQLHQTNAQISKLDRELGQLTVLPRLLAKDPRVINALTVNDKFSILEADLALAQIQKDSDIAFAFLMDADGDTIAASNWQESVSFVGENYGFRPYFKGAIKGQETTFFAVGATTSVPGYFIAYPLIEKGDIFGVIVVKIDVDNLLSIWLEQPYTTIVNDEFGVVILSSNSEFLYSLTRNLDENELQTIYDERRYELVESHQFTRQRSNIWRHIDGSRSDSRTEFLAVSSPIKREQWVVTRLVPLKNIRQTAGIYVTTLAVLTLLSALLVKIYRHQRELAAFEHRHALQLAEQVQERTRELEATQRALIAESNFAMLGRMSAAINHEINQPLASLRLNLASLRRLVDDEHGNSSELRTVAVDCDRTTKRIGRVIETLRNVARQGHTEFHVVNVAHVMSDVVETINRERPQMSKSLRIEICDQPATVSGNAILLQQALLNMIYNAFDAVLNIDNPDVLLQLRHTGEFVVVDVHDNGGGVSPVLSETLFTPFSTGENKTSGMGLGLTLASQIAVDHSGTISFQISPIGGSHFSLSIPVLFSTQIES